MNHKKDIKVLSGLSSKLDSFIWVMIVVLVLAGAVAGYYLNTSLWTLKFVLGLLWFGALLGMIALTVKGKKILKFSDEVLGELKKVVWPTKDETLKVTAVVVVLVFAMSTVLWLIDSVLMVIISRLTR